jgi:hypothetical protein
MLESMLESALPLTRELRQLFFQLGVTAASDLKGVEALQMFTALEIAEPDEAYPKVGIGLAAILMGDFEGASNYLQHPVVQNSALAGSASSFQAMAHHLNGNLSGFQRSAEMARIASSGEFDDVLNELASSPVPDLNRPAPL